MSQENKPNIQGTSRGLKQIEKNAELEKKRKEKERKEKERKEKTKR